MSSFAANDNQPEPVKTANSRSSSQSMSKNVINEDDELEYHDSGPNLDLNEMLKHQTLAVEIIPESEFSMNNFMTRQATMSAAHSSLQKLERLSSSVASNDNRSIAMSQAAARASAAAASVVLSEKLLSDPVNSTSEEQMALGATGALVDPRIKICLEIVSSEESYVGGLQIMLNQFQMRLEALNVLPDQKPLLSSQEIDNIFVNIKDVCDLNDKFLTEMHELLEEDDLTLMRGIGSLFMYYAQFFKIYALYCNAYHAANRLLEKLVAKKPEFKAFLAVSQYCAGLPLESYLISPVQRIPRYVLLLDQLIKNSPGREPISQLEEARKVIGIVADQINTSMVRSESRQKVVDIQKKIFKNKLILIEPSRYCIKIGELEKVHQNAKYHLSKTRKCILILFNDLFVYATPTTSSTAAEVKIKCPLTELIVEDIADSLEEKYTFRIQSKEKSVVFLASSKKVKIEWLNALQESKLKMTTSLSSLNGTNKNLAGYLAEAIAKNSSLEPTKTHAGEKPVTGIRVSGDITNHKAAPSGFFGAMKNLGKLPKNTAAGKHEVEDEKLDDAYFDNLILQMDHDVIRSSVVASRQFAGSVATLRPYSIAGSRKFRSIVQEKGHKLEDDDDLKN